MTSFVRWASNILSVSALLIDSHNPVQGGCRDVQPLGHCNIILYIFIYSGATDNKHPGPPKHIPAHVNPILVFLGNSVIDKQRQIQQRADR